MRKATLTFVLCVAAWGQDAPTQPAAPKKASVAATKATTKKAVQTKTVKAPAKAVDPGQPPKTAKDNGDGSFSWTDPKGKRWISRKTPFGWMRSENTGLASEPGVGSVDPSVKVSEAGDNVHFEKATPFGTTKWDKRKADLTDGERSALEHANAERANGVKEVVAK